MSLAPFAQSLLVLLLPALSVVLPSEGRVRTVAIGSAPISAVINRVIAADGRIVAARGREGLIVEGRRDRIAYALLPLGVLAFPTMVGGCSAPRKEG